MTKLNQMLAIAKSDKEHSFRGITEAHHAALRTTQLAGLARTYRPRDEEGEQQPPESTKVQVKAQELIRQVQTAMTKYFDTTATIEWANTKAHADVTVTGTVLVKAAPITYLLFLEKQLEELHTFIMKLPTLDPAEEWEYDTAQDCFKTPVVQTNRTKKVPRNHVKAEATDKHPAQVEVYTEDIVVGTWNTTKFSGALPAARVNELAERVEALQKAVKFAREEANSLVIEDQKVGEAVLGWLFK